MTLDGRTPRRTGWQQRLLLKPRDDDSKMALWGEFCFKSWLFEKSCIIQHSPEVHGNGTSSLLLLHKEVSQKLELRLSPRFGRNLEVES